VAVPDYTLEEQTKGHVAGVDEAGRGPWAGPVVAAAVILDKTRLPLEARDSKKLLPKKREALFHVIKETAMVSVGISEIEEIDRLNILGATKLAMQRAVKGLKLIPQMVLVDGDHLPELWCPAKAIIKGDDLSLSIAAASIIAKVTRDRIMTRLHEEFPHFGWDTNAGYGTPDHVRALEKYGPTPHHRRSFAPIRKLLEMADAG
jgi:ribonuclease HII